MARQAGISKDKFVVYLTAREGIALRHVAQKYATTISDVLRAAVVEFQPIKEHLLNPGRPTTPPSPMQSFTFGDPTREAK